MITALILLVLGLLFVYLEFFLPGAILGTIGGIFLVISIVLFANASQSIPFSFLYAVLVFVLLAVLIRYTLKKIPKTKSKYSIYLNGDQTGYMASTYDRTAIGKTGTVLSDLKPGGYITIEGKKHQAISQSGYIPHGEKVIVLGGEEESLIVKSKTKKEVP